MLMLALFPAGVEVWIEAQEHLGLFNTGKVSDVPEYVKALNRGVLPGPGAIQVSFNALIGHQPGCLTGQSEVGPTRCCWALSILSCA
jgi:hypothetical protein